MSEASLYFYRAKLVRIVDGDTVDLDIDLGLDVSRVIRCRLYGINAPEKNTPEGKAAIAWLQSRLVNAKLLTAQTIKDRTEKYGRYLVVLFDDQINSINSEMLTAGHAKEYYGIGPRP